VYELNFNPEQSGFSLVSLTGASPAPTTVLLTMMSEGGEVTQTVCAHLCPCGPSSYQAGQEPKVSQHLPPTLRCVASGLTLPQCGQPMLPDSWVDPHLQEMESQGKSHGWAGHPGAVRASPGNQASGPLAIGHGLSPQAAQQSQPGTGVRPTSHSCSDPSDSRLMAFLG
jgi:hypothetical protein